MEPPPIPGQPISCPSLHTHPHLCRDCDFDLNTRLNIDDDLLDDLGRRIEINQSLVDPHLVHVPGLRTLTARRFACGNLQALGRQTHGALDAELLGLGAVNELLANFLQGCDFARGQGDADLVGFLAGKRRVSFESVRVATIKMKQCDILGPRQSLSRASGKTYL